MLITDSRALELRKKIVDWLSEYLSGSSREGFVMGFSGGVDSTVIALLGKEAAEKVGKKFLPLFLSIELEKEYYDKESALRVASQFDFPLKEIDLTHIFSELKSMLPTGDQKPVVYTNLKARLRIAIIYYYANLYNFLVLGTVNKGEFYIGYFPKNASAGDILPIAGLLKKEIRAIARTYGVPEDIVNRKASGCIWAQTAEEEWGFTEDELDYMIEVLEKDGEKKLLNDSKISISKVQLFLQKYNESAHKRKFYPIFTYIN